MSIAKHIKEHIALGLRGGFSRNVLTVDINGAGQFQYLEEALQYAKDNSTPVSVKGDMNGTVSVTQYDDLVTLADATVNFGGSNLPDPEWASDLYINNNLTNTHLFRRSFLEIDGDGIYRPYEYVNTATTLTLSAGHAAGVSGATWDVFTIPHYTILLMPGRQRMSRDYGEFNCGPYMNIDIVGLGTNVSVYEQLMENRIRAPISGHFGLENLTIVHAGSSMPILNAGIGAPDTAQSQGLDFSVINVVVRNTEHSIAADVFNLYTARSTIDNMVCISRGDVVVLFADTLMVRNVRLDTLSGAGNRFDFRFLPHQRNKPAYITNVSGITGARSGTQQSLGVEEDGAGSAGFVKQVHIKDLLMPDGGLLHASANGRVVVNVADSIIQELICDTGGTLRHSNVRPLTGALTTSGSGTFETF